jgi:hypothetical protein
VRWEVLPQKVTKEYNFEEESRVRVSDVVERAVNQNTLATWTDVATIALHLRC